ncbi:MAG: hypothetical protein HY709_01260 [Candidatus Latescibacteria bacterium]|nr:hypothetical protein [Candidatus Latescibacterota bacterium]
MSSSTDGILALLQEQLNCCRKLETTAEDVIDLLQSDQVDHALVRMQERDRIRQHLEEIEANLGKRQITTLDPLDRTALSRHGRPIAEAIRTSVEHQLEMEGRIAHLLSHRIEHTGEVMRDMREGQKLFTTYVEEWGEGSGVDITVT